IRTAVRSLAQNRMRTSLTALGMVIGVAAVVAVLAVGEGAQSSVEGRIRALGTNLLYVRPAFGGVGGVRTGRVETLKRADAEAIASLPGVTAVAPEVSGSGQIRYREVNQNASVLGVTPEYLSVRALEVTAGLGFDELVDVQRRRVAIIGANVATDLFGREQPLGQRIQILGISFRVIGVLAPKGDAGMSSP